MQKSRFACSHIAPRNHPQLPPSPPPPGNKKVHRHRKLQSFPSDSDSYGSGAADEDLHSFKLGWRYSKQLFGTPMKKLLAEEMTREAESRSRGPGVIARLMGLDGLPMQLPANKQHKSSSENHLQRTAHVGKTRSSETLYEGRSSRRSSKDQLEFKDVFEVPEIPKVESSRYSLQGSEDLKMTDAEMSFIEQNFMDAKCHANYQDLQSSQNFHDTLEVLYSSDDLPPKYFRQPDSLYEKHLDDLQDAPLQSHFGHLQAMKSSDVEKYEHGDFRWKSDRETIRLNRNRSHHKNHDGYHYRSDRRHAMHRSPKSSKLGLKGRHEPDAFPTRIVILKPNCGKMQDAAKAVSSPCAPHTFLSERGKLTEFSDIIFRDIELNQNNNVPDTVWHSRQNSLESREIAKEITSQMKNSLNNGSVIFSSSRFGGYNWDDSSCSSSGNEAPEESEVTTVTLGNSFDIRNSARPSSHSSESSVSREAKKRLSERWKSMHKPEQGQSICRSSTLAEMLAIPAKETKAANFDSMSCGEHFHDKVASNGKLAGWVEPLGISSRDGWKDGCIGSLPRSKSLPASSTAFGSAKTILHHEALHDDRYMMPKDTLKRERKKVVKSWSSAQFNQRQCVNTRSSRSAHKKSWSSHSLNIESDESSPDLLTIQNKVKIDLEEYSAKQEVLPTNENVAAILGDTSAVAEGVVDVINENVAGSSQSSNEVLPELSSCVLIKDDSNAVDGDKLMQEELSVGSSSRSSVSCQPPVAGLESSCCKDADQPSPVSVLEPSFTDDLSSCSECFESLSVDLQGLRMQLQLLKSESEEHVEGTMQTSSDEDGREASTGISENTGSLRTEDSWESSYLADVLSESGIGEAQPDTFLDVWHSLESPVSLSVFDELEKRYSDWTTCPRHGRRLLFDRINSGIAIILQERFMNALPRVSPATPNLGSKLIKNGLQDYLYRMLGSQGKAKDTALGKLLVSESQWLNLRDDIDVIGREVESLLLDDLVSEMASSFTFCN